MKKTITLIINASMMITTLTLSGQHHFSQNQFLVSLPKSTLESPTAVKHLLQDNNASKVWADDQIGIQLWQVESFPYVTEDGTLISNINESVMHSQDKTEIDEAGLDYQTYIPWDNQMQPNCNQSNYKIYVTQGGAPVKVAILDTGISEIEDNSQAGFDFFLPSYTGYDYVNEDDDPTDDNGHGSHVAGVIADIVNNSEITNVSFDIRKTHGGDGSGYVSATVRAIAEAVEAGANVINMSFSFSASGNMEGGILQRAIDYAESHNVLVVASAGNNGINNDELSNATYPASYSNDNIISVASIGCNNDLSPFSNYGAGTVDIAILGEDVAGPDLASGLTFKDGTSQAAAIISGLAAVLGTHQTAFDPSEIKCLLISTSAYTPSLSGLITSNGIVNGESALERLLAHGCSGAGTPAMAMNRSIDRINAKVYPNPTRDYVNITLKKFDNTPLTISIVDTNGRIVASYTDVSGTILQIDAKRLPPGRYQAVVNSENTVSYSSFIKI